MIQRYLPFLLLLSAVGLSACSETPVAPKATTAAVFTLNSQNKFFVYDTDTSAANYGKPILGTEDTLTQTVVSVSDTKDGRSNVVRILSLSSRTGNTDTLYYAQDADENVYRYNYGLETLGNNPEIVAIFGRPINVGWVLMTKLNASVGDGWRTGFDTLSFSGTTVTLSDTVTYVGKSSMTVGGTTYTTYHTSHLVRPVIPAHSASGTINNYFVPEIGASVVSDISPSSISGLIYNSKYPGRHTELYSHVQ